MCRIRRAEGLFLIPHYKEKALQKASPSEGPGGPEGIETVFPICRTLLEGEQWDRIVGSSKADEIPDLLEGRVDKGDVPAFLPALARLEGVLHEVAMGSEQIPSDVDRLMLNPTIHLLELPWKDLPSLIHSQGDIAAASPQQGDETVLAWLDPHSGTVQVRAATDEDLLVLKMVA